MKVSGRVYLNVCPKCGMDSGTRKIKEEVPIQYFVVCERCGYITHGCRSQSAATAEWNRGKI